MSVVAASTVAHYSWAVPTASVAMKVARWDTDPAAASLTLSPAKERLDQELARVVLRAVDEGVPVSVLSFRLAHAVLMGLPDDITVPEIVVEPDGEVALDWQEGPRQALTIIVGAGSLGFAALLGHESIHGRIPFVGSIPATLLGLLARVVTKPPRGAAAASSGA